MGVYAKELKKHVTYAGLAKIANEYAAQSSLEKARCILDLLNNQQ